MWLRATSQLLQIWFQSVCHLLCTYQSHEPTVFLSVGDKEVAAS